jgi:hypothetical protein
MKTKTKVFGKYYPYVEVRYAGGKVERMTIQNLIKLYENKILKNGGDKNEKH